MVRHIQMAASVNEGALDSLQTTRRRVDRQGDWQEGRREAQPGTMTACALDWGDAAACEAVRSMFGDSLMSCCISEEEGEEEGEEEEGGARLWIVGSDSKVTAQTPPTPTTLRSLHPITLCAP